MFGCNFQYVGVVKEYCVRDVFGFKLLLGGRLRVKVLINTEHGGNEGAAHHHLKLYLKHQAGFLWEHTAQISRISYHD